MDRFSSAVRSSLAIRTARISHNWTFTVALLFFGLAGDWLFDFVRRQVPGDVHTRAFLKVGGKLGEIAEAGDAMSVGVGLPLALGAFPGALRPR